MFIKTCSENRSFWLCSITVRLTPEVNQLVFFPLNIFEIELKKLANSKQVSSVSCLKFAHKKRLTETNGCDEMITLVFGWSIWLVRSGSTSHRLLKSNANWWSVSFGVSMALEGGEVQLGLVSLLSPMIRWMVLAFIDRTIRSPTIQVINGWWLVRTCRMKGVPFVRNVGVELSHPLLDYRFALGDGVKTVGSFCRVGTGCNLRLLQTNSHRCNLHGKQAPIIPFIMKLKWINGKWLLNLIKIANQQSKETTSRRWQRTVASFVSGLLIVNRRFGQLRIVINHWLQRTALCVRPHPTFYSFLFIFTVDWNGNQVDRQPSD